MDQLKKFVSHNNFLLNMDEATRSQAKSLEEIKDLLLGFQNDV